MLDRRKQKTADGTKKRTKSADGETPPLQRTKKKEFDRKTPCHTGRRPSYKRRASKDETCTAGAASDALQKKEA